MCTVLVREDISPLDEPVFDSALAAVSSSLREPGIYLCQFSIGLGFVVGSGLPVVESHVVLWDF